MTKDEQQDALLDWVDQGDYPVDKVIELGTALYAFSERSIWPSDVEIDTELAIAVWEVVETVKRKGFPNDLRM
jgi:hypothetical protein